MTGLWKMCSQRYLSCSEARSRPHSILFLSSFSSLGKEWPFWQPNLNQIYLLKDLNSLSVWCFRKWSLNQTLQIVNVSWFLLLDKCKIFFVILQNEFNAILNVSFGAFHSVVNISEGKLWLNHPKFSHMATCMRNLSSECGTKRINIRQGTAKVFNCQLPWYG